MKIVKVIFTIFLLLLFLPSCKSLHHFEGRRYELNTAQEVIKLNFINDSVCEVQQYFTCDLIPDSLKNTAFNFSYKFEKFRYRHKRKFLPKTIKFKILKVQNLDSSFKNFARITYIPNYSQLCEEPLLINSVEDKLRKIFPTGVIFNLVNDTLVLEKNVIVIGYKHIPRVN